MKSSWIHLTSSSCVVVLAEESQDVGFRADLVVEGKVIVEMKSVAELAPVHKKQLLIYLRLSGLRLGLLIDFKGELIKDGIVRIVNKLD